MSRIVSIDSGRETRRLDRMRENLPARDTVRWVASRKAAVVAAVDAGAIDAEQACTRYGLSVEELSHWRDSVGKHGMHALLVTKMQRFRESSGDNTRDV